ncbi:MAG: rod shape-determining protein MreC [Planctomycetota bacterium]|jgi:cell shape-determining protein MreC
MPRAASRSQRALWIAVALSAVLALLPARWLGWTVVAADIANVPIQPLADAGVRLGRALRGPEGGVAEESEALRRRTEELDTTRALLHAARLRIEALQEEIRHLQDARRFHQGVQIDPMFVRVTGRSPDRGRGPVRINAGRRHGVTPGTVAVYRGAHLIGRVADDVGRLSCRIVPVTDPATGLMEAVILPADDPAAEVADAPRLQLTADGQGALEGDLDRNRVVQVGDIVLLSDPGWPDSAQGMILGTVTSLAPKDLQPLHNLITVTPRFHATHVASVTLKIERMASGQGPTQEGPSP